MAAVSETTTTERRVPRTPLPHKELMKINLFEAATKNLGQLQLLPVFPYLDPGSIVPCITLSKGGADYVDFQFWHSNDRQEILLCLAANGCTMDTGQLMLPPVKHAVDTFLRDPKDEESYAVWVISVRMAEGDVQNEGFSIRCRDCNDFVFQRFFDVIEGPQRDHLPEFYALRYYADACKEYNASEALRTCAGCGTVQDEFPLDQFGWSRYADNIEIADHAMSELVTAGTAAGGDA